MSKRKSPPTSKPKRAMNAYAFFVQHCREEEKKGDSCETTNLREFTKSCSSKWNAMDDSDKKQFKDLALEDRKRYVEEMKNYNPNDEENGETIAKKAKIDPKSEPKSELKRPRTSFIFFCNEKRDGVKREHSDWTMTQISKELGKLWQAMPIEEKMKFNQMAETDKARYLKEVKENSQKNKNSEEKTE